jgi:hypothetical protein
MEKLSKLTPGAALTLAGLPGGENGALKPAG